MDAPCKLQSCLLAPPAALRMVQDVAQATGLDPAGATARGRPMESVVWTQLKTEHETQRQKESTKLT